MKETKIKRGDVALCDLLIAIAWNYQQMYRRISDSQLYGNGLVSASKVLNQNKELPYKLVQILPLQAYYQE